MSKMFPTIYICDVKNSGGHLFRVEKTPPRPPEKTPGGESFDSLSPGTPSIKLDRIEAASFQRHIYLCPTMGRAGAGQIEAPGVKTIEPTLVHPVLTLGLSWRAREAILWPGKEWSFATTQLKI